MRHLNELVRERNQYARDALEAWQDFITLKGRMDTEISKITKRNNFLVEELESWKQQVFVSVLLSWMTIYLPWRLFSSSNSNPLQKRSPRRPKSSRSRSIITSARIDVLPALSSSRKTTLLDSPCVSPAPRSNGTMLSRLSSSSKRLPRSSNAKGSGTKRNYLRSNGPIRPSCVRKRRLNASWCIYEA